MAFQAIRNTRPSLSAKLFLQKRSGGIENQYPLSLAAFAPSTDNCAVVAVAVGMAVGRVALVAATG